MYYLGLAVIGIIGFILGKKLAQFRAAKKANQSKKNTSTN